MRQACETWIGDIT